MRTRLTPRLIVRLSFAFVVAAVLIPAVPDVDLWGHTLFGGDIVHSRAIPAADSYAFTSDLPWVNHEWLSEVCMYAAYALGPASRRWSSRWCWRSLLIPELSTFGRNCSR
ncbi:MAG: hypothetical protein DMG02_18620 [Acidobacteria bacterium]|nr:MAG: hypothetical protein DMG02_18620 [Acidobacteriota bacterium]